LAPLLAVNPTPQWREVFGGALQGDKSISTLLLLARPRSASAFFPHEWRGNMAPANTNEIRALTEDEIARLENALGQPIERSYLVHWVSQAIQAFLLLMTLPPPRERRDDLKKIAEQGRKWIETVEQSRSTPLLPAVLLPAELDLEHLISSVHTFCDLVESLARQLDQAVGPGHPRTNLALDAFLDRLIGIAKRARVRPSTPNRAFLDPRYPGPVPPFYDFVSEALEIAMEVIRSSPLPRDQMDAALAMLASVTDQSLVKALEGLRGRIGNYREGTIGLVEWDIAEDDEPDRPDHSESRAE
jgi:hypothetical protein